MSNNYMGRYFDNIVKGIANIHTLTYIAFARCKIPCSCISDLFKLYLQNEKVRQIIYIHSVSLIFLHSCSGWILIFDTLDCPRIEVFRP